MSKREIKVLDDYEHILLRPTMYISSVEATEEKISLIDSDNVLRMYNMNYSVGMYKLFDEILDNSFDEIIHITNQDNNFNGKIKVQLNTIDNSITIEDNGRGFYKGIEINKKSGKNNIETAVTELRAGSNFNNDNESATLLGTNGVGASIVNVLSDYFYIESSDGEYSYSKVWKKFVGEDIVTKYKEYNTGTYVKFIPRVEIFKKEVYDPIVIKTKMTFKYFLKNINGLKKLNIELYIDGEEVCISKGFLPSDSVVLKSTETVSIIAWRKYEKSHDISFVNSSLCTGIHQKIIQEYINKIIFDNDNAHYFYNFLVIMNLPPKYVKFGDQNKSKFVSTRSEISNIVKLNIQKDRLDFIFESEWFKNIKFDIENSLKKEEINKLKRERKKLKHKISDKYFPSTKNKNLFIVEGLSALGGLNQSRNTTFDSLYALKGKIKNTRSISDLSSNMEIVELINILGLDLSDGGESCTFDKIIVSSDQDFDGGHIMSLIVNFFYKWFPNIIKNGKLFRLAMPLISLEKKGIREYFYSINEFNLKKNVGGEVRYLKGLGSYDIKDWEYIFSNKKLLQINLDSDMNVSTNILEMAFGNSSKLRKDWLMG